MTSSKSKADQADDDRILTAAFFDRPALKVAHDLIGYRLHYKNGEQSDSCIITEVEAYIGTQDLASHASKGRTKRNEAMFGALLWASLALECRHRSSWLSRCCFD
jgi:hypothetical protein